MSPLARVLVLPSLLMFALMCSSESRAADDPSPTSAAGAALRAAGLDGTWTGRLKSLYDPQMWPEDDTDVGFKFVVDGTRMQVEQSIRTKQGQMTTTALAPLHVKRVSASAVAYSQETGTDEDGTWVETISFVMTLKDPDHLIVHWTRLVNNLDVPLEKKSSKFSQVGMGELTRSR